MEFLQFFVTGFSLSLLLCLDIGIVNTAIINTAIRKGFLPAFVIGFGSCFGDLLYAILSISGLVVLFKITIVKLVVWITGNLLLMILIIKMIYSIKKSITQTYPNSFLQEKLVNFFSTGFFISLASPSSIIWFLSIGGALIASTNANSSLHSLFPFFFGFFTAGLLWSFSLAMVISKVRHYFSNLFIFWINLVSIFILILLGGYSIINGFKVFAKI